jgi:hypothetical protein
MAVYRQVQITYWQDKFVLKLTPEEKFFYLYLLTNSKTKQCGIYELPIEIVQVETGYNRETIIKLIQKFIEYKKIKYDWEHEEIIIFNWLKHNPIKDNLNIVKCIEKELREVHNTDLIPLDSPLQVFLQKEKEEEKEKTEEEGQLETARMLWISIFTNNPGSVEKEFVSERIKFGGISYTKKLFRDFREMGFHKVRTMKEALDESGNIKPKSQNETRKEITYDEFCKLPIDGQKKYKKNKDNNIWELINV